MNKSNITILNLNMLYLKYFDKIDREQHIPLGPLYLTRAIENAGYTVDFRDYQLNTYEDPFSLDNCIDFLQDSAPIIGISVMANLLPFAILLGKELKHRYPQKTIILGGVGAKSVESEILRRFPEIDIIAYGEGEVAGPILVDHLVHGEDLAGCVEMRYGVESGSEEILKRTVKGFDLEQAIEIVSESSQVFPSVDAFFIWGFPFETMEQFYQTVFLMNSFRMIGVRVLPSLLCYLPQTRIYQEVDKEKLEFSYEMILEYMITGHETCFPASSTTILNTTSNPNWRF